MKEPSLFEQLVTRALKSDPDTAHAAAKHQQRSGRAAGKRQLVHRALAARGKAGGTVFEIAEDIGMADQVQNMSNIFAQLERKGLAYRTGSTRRNPTTKMKVTIWWALQPGEQPPANAQKTQPFTYRELYDRAVRCLEANRIEFDPMEW